VRWLRKLLEGEAQSEAIKSAERPHADAGAQGGTRRGHAAEPGIRKPIEESIPFNPSPRRSKSNPKGPGGAFSKRRNVTFDSVSTPGSPGATTTIDGRYLPPPPQPFRGAISPNAAQSKPYWPQIVVPPKGAPNVLLIMTDDVGFSAPSTFGGVIPTPALDRIAQTGLRYTRFHTTALCSPTRAALLTGRNHHSVATGVVVDQATGYPGYNSVIPRDAVAIGEILRQNGYDTSWYGKDHNVPQWEGSQAGPFHNWPTGSVKGFDYYYGFIGDDTSQWQPNNLFRNTTPIEPYLGKPGWNLITAMADEAIGRIKMLNEVQPDRPFLIYYAPGATHAPHHPTKEWVDKISAMRLFDKGFQAVREQIFANQKKLGVIPQNAKLTAWPKDVPQWDTLPAETKKLYIHQANIYAAYLAYTDHEIGRVIQAVADAGKLDNTLVIYIQGDNGASAEGTPQGLLNEMTIANKSFRRGDAMTNRRNFLAAAAALAASTAPLERARALGRGEGGRLPVRVEREIHGLRQGERQAHPAGPGSPLGRAVRAPGRWRLPGIPGIGRCFRSGRLIGKRIGLSPRLDLCQSFRHRILRRLAVEVSLQADPEALGHAEEARQAQAGVGGDRALAGDDLTDAPLRHADLLRQPVLRDAHRLEELLEQDLARGGIRYLAHGSLRQW
jgi:arylsulfatase A-like enzyme